MSLSAHQSAAMKHDEWLTPPEILRPLGKFDLDPCAPIMRPWDTAAKHLNVNDDGLRQPWHGRVWCNPPFGREAVKWLNRMVQHGNGIALIFARTETKAFQEHCWRSADAMLFMAGRIKFRLPGGVKNFASDEQVRETSLEALAKLNSVFSEVGVLTAGNCSGIVDGAASSVITTKEFIENRKFSYRDIAGKTILKKKYMYLIIMVSVEAF